MKTYSLAFLGRARRRRSHTAKFKLEAMRDFGKSRSIQWSLPNSMATAELV
jgi:hypothetical protein